MSQSPDLSTGSKKSGGLPVPKEIFRHLEENMFGQEYAKKAISVGVYNHFKRIGAQNSLVNRLDGNSELKRIFELLCNRVRDCVAQTGQRSKGSIVKSNMILIGPTGCGKTELAKTVAKYLDIPFAICDCTSLTEAGYVGDDVEQTLAELHMLAGGNVPKTEMGIVFLDEVDKIRISRGYNDVGGRGVQEALLKMVEGNMVRVPKHGGQKSRDEIVFIDTTNILFIASGAFDGLEDIVRQRLDEESQNGTGQRSPRIGGDEDSSWLEHIDHCDLVKYRMMPEFVGRFPMIVPLRPLDEQALFGILTMSNNSIIGQYERLFEMDGAKLQFDKDAISEIARMAHTKKTGQEDLKL